jgi:phage terminase small subunit
MAKTPKPLNDNGLNNVEQSFVNQYLMNGCSNASAAFLAINNNVTNETAAQKACRILKRPNVKKFLDAKRKEILEKENIELSYIVQGLKKIIDEVSEETTERDPKTGRITNKPDRFAAIKAFEVLAKMGGYVDKKQDVLIQSTGEINISFGGFDPDKTLSLPRKASVNDEHIIDISNIDSKDSLTPPGTNDSSEFTDYIDNTNNNE